MTRRIVRDKPKTLAQADEAAATPYETDQGQAIHDAIDGMEIPNAVKGEGAQKEEKKPYKRAAKITSLAGRCSHCLRAIPKGEAIDGLGCKCYYKYGKSGKLSAKGDAMGVTEASIRLFGGTRTPEAIRQMLITDGEHTPYEVRGHQANIEAKPEVYKRVAEKRGLAFRDDSLSGAQEALQQMGLSEKQAVRDAENLLNERRAKEPTWTASHRLLDDAADAKALARVREIIESLPAYVPIDKTAMNSYSEKESISRAMLAGKIAKIDPKLADLCCPERKTFMTIMMRRVRNKFDFIKTNEQALEALSEAMYGQNQDGSLSASNNLLGQMKNSGLHTPMFSMIAKNFLDAGRSETAASRRDNDHLVLMKSLGLLVSYQPHELEQEVG